MFRSVTVLATVFFSLLVTGGSAFAAVDSSTINTQTATLSFGTTQQVQHTLKPVDGLSVNTPIGSTLATGSVSAFDGNIASLALRFTPGLETQYPLGNGRAYLEAVGGGKHIYVFFSNDAGNSGTDQPDHWTSWPNTSELKYSIELESDPPDVATTYILSMQAGVWVS